MQQALYMIAGTIGETAGLFAQAVRITILPAVRATFEPYREEIRAAFCTYIAGLVAVTVFIA